MSTYSTSKGFDGFTNDPFTTNVNDHSVQTTTTSTEPATFSVQYTQRFLQHFAKRPVSILGFGGLPVFFPVGDKQQTQTHQKHQPTNESNNDAHVTPTSSVSSPNSSYSASLNPASNSLNQTEVASTLTKNHNDQHSITTDASGSHSGQLERSNSTKIDTQASTSLSPSVGSDKKELSPSESHKTVSTSTQTQNEKSVNSHDHDAHTTEHSKPLTAQQYKTLREKILEKERMEIEAETKKLTELSNQTADLHKRGLKVDPWPCESEGRIVTECYRVNSYETLLCNQFVKDYVHCAYSR